MNAILTSLIYALVALSLTACCCDSMSSCDCSCDCFDYASCCGYGALSPYKACEPCDPCEPCGPYPACEPCEPLMCDVHEECCAPSPYSNPCATSVPPYGYSVVVPGRCQYDPYCDCNCCPMRLCPCKPRACLKPNGGGYHPIGYKACGC